MTNHRLASFALAAMLWAPLSCGPSMDTEQATALCDRLAADLVSCIDDTARNECIACHEDCGRECRLVDTTCPHTFTCE